MKEKHKTYDQLHTDQIQHIENAILDFRMNKATLDEFRNNINITYEDIGLSDDQITDRKNRKVYITPKERHDLNKETEQIKKALQK